MLTQMRFEWWLWAAEWVSGGVVVGGIGSRGGSSVLMGASVATAVGESVGFSVCTSAVGWWLKEPRPITVSTAVARLGGVFRAVGPGCEPLW